MGTLQDELYVQFFSSVYSRLSILFLAGFLGGSGLLTSLVNLFDGLDDTDSDSLSHVTNSETTKRWVFGERFNTHWLGRNHLNDGSITRFDEFGGIFEFLTGTAIDLFDEFGEFTGDVGSVAIEHRTERKNC